jgi:hypothetical protein
MMRIWSGLAMIALLLFAAPAAAAAPLSIDRYWAGFRNFWSGVFGSVGGVVGLVLIIGLISLFIITRGKWLK